MKADQCLDKLIKFYFPYFKPSGEYKTKFIEAISRFPDAVIRESYDWTTDNDAKPPALSSFRAYCYEFQDRAEAMRHAAQMANDRKAADQIFKSDGYGNEYAKACFANIKLAMSGKVTIREFIENSKILKINLNQHLGGNSCSFMVYIDQWNVDIDNILGAHLMHNFTDTKGYKIRK